MALPHAVLLPNTLLPLHIFELRYQQMLEHCLERERMFCLAMMRPGVTEAYSVDDLYAIAGLGLVRASVAAEDGTSNLVLRGLARVELLEFVQEEPFRIARLREVKSEMPNVVEAEALGTKVLELCSQLEARGLELPAALKGPAPHLSQPDALADIVAGACLRDPYQRQQLLECGAVSERLRLLIKYLRGVME